jgi:hypothetical protein
MNNDNTINNEDNPSTGQLRMEDIAWIVEELAMKSIEVLRANPALYHQVADEMGVTVEDIEQVGAYLEEPTPDCTCPACMGRLMEDEVLDVDPDQPKPTYH